MSRGGRIFSFQAFLLHGQGIMTFSKMRRVNNGQSPEFREADRARDIMA